MSDEQTGIITFIGGGNMARSLIGGLIKAGHPRGQIRASDPSAEQRALLQPLGVVVTEDNSAAIDGAATVVLAVKPQILATVLTQLQGLQPEQLLISIAAGVPLESLQRWSTPTQAVVRCMPNTPALLGAGMTALFANNRITPPQRRQAEAVLGAAGATLWVRSEAQLDAVTGVSGSGPAYFFYLMEAMIDAGVALGLDSATATRLTLETAYGAALMARESALPPATLRANVTSPGGTTERAVSILEAGGVRSVIQDAITGAAARSRELAEEYGNS